MTITIRPNARIKSTIPNVYNRPACKPRVPLLQRTDVPVFKVVREVRL